MTNDKEKRMTTTGQFTVAHDSPYSERQTHSHAEFTLDPRPGLCQGRKPAGKHSFRSMPCLNKATRVITAKPYTYRHGPYDAIEADEVELHVCGTHDLLAKGNRKAAEAREQRMAQARKEDRQLAARRVAEHTVARINATVGSTVVEVQPNYRDRQYTGYVSYPIVVTNSAALEAALQSTVV